MPQSSAVTSVVASKRVQAAVRGTTQLTVAPRPDVLTSESPYIESVAFLSVSVDVPVSTPCSSTANAVVGGICVAVVAFLSRLQVSDPVTTCRSPDRSPGDVVSEVDLLGVGSVSQKPFQGDSCHCGFVVEDDETGHSRRSPWAGVTGLSVIAVSAWDTWEAAWSLGASGAHDGSGAGQREGRSCPAVV